MKKFLSISVLLLVSSVLFAEKTKNNFILGLSIGGGLSLTFDGGGDCGSTFGELYWDDETLFQGEESERITIAKRATVSLGYEIENKIDFLATVSYSDKPLAFEPIAKVC